MLSHNIYSIQYLFSQLIGPQFPAVVKVGHAHAVSNTTSISANYSFPDIYPILYSGFWKDEDIRSS